MRELLAFCFERMGFDTCQAQDNSEALAKAVTRHPNLITTDMNRPGGSGLQFIHEIRATATLRDRPIWIISGGATAEQRQETERLGVTVTMRKPIEPSQLYTTIEQLIPKD